MRHPVSNAERFSMLRDAMSPFIFTLSFLDSVSRENSRPVRIDPGKEIIYSLKASLLP